MRGEKSGLGRHQFLLEFPLGRSEAILFSAPLRTFAIALIDLLLPASNLFGHSVIPIVLLRPEVTDMETHNPVLLRRELIQLTEMQIDTLEKPTFGGVTQAEQREYDERQERIRDLFTELHHLDPAT